MFKKLTRGNATLDLILTNINCWYKDPDILPAVGQSDHMSVMLHPLVDATSKCKFYESQVSHLKNSEPKKWWSAIKQLGGSSSKAVFKSVEVDGIVLQ